MELPLQGCAEDGGCAADYVAVALSACVIVFVAVGTLMIFRKRNIPEIKAKQVSLMVLQSIASIIFIAALLMSRNTFKLSRHSGGIWLSCQLWQIWLEGPAGFGLLISCHLARAYRLYHVFVGRRLPPLKSFQLLPLLLLPWIVAAGVLEGVGPFSKSNRCVPHSYWWVVVVCLHLGYSILLLLGTWKIRNIRFEFNEFRELLAGGSLCVVFIAVAILLSVWSVIKENQSEVLEVAMRTILVVLGDMVVIFFFWFPVSRPFMAQLGVKLRGNGDTMGQALGVPPSGLLVPPTRTAMNFEEPLDCLLQNKRFRLSFLTFADSRMAGEAVHFYDEVRVFNRMPLSNFVARIYMATHIIDKYIQVGSRMEINISHQMRSEILNTMDLTNPNLFKRAVSEAVKMMQMNLEKDYWSSPHFHQLKDELDAEAEYSEQLERMSIRNFPLRRLSYDPLPNYDNPFETGQPAAGDEDGIWMPIDDFSDCGKYDTDGNLVQPAMYLNDPDCTSTFSVDSSGDGAQVGDACVETDPCSPGVESIRKLSELSEPCDDVKSQQEEEPQRTYHRPSRSA